MTKKILIGILLLVTILSGCETKKAFQGGYAIVYENGIPYLLNKDGEKKSLEKYDEIDDRFGEYIIVKSYRNQKLLCGYIDHNGNEIIKPTYDMAYPFSENKAVVVKNNQYQIINPNNKVLYSFEKDFTSSQTYHNGFLRVEKNGQYTFLNSSFELGSKFYDTLANFSCGYALVSYFENNLKHYNFINGNYELLFNDELDNYSFVDSFYDDYSRVGKKVNGKIAYSFIDKDGNILQDDAGSTEFEYAQNFHYGKTVVFSGKPYGSYGTEAYYSLRFMNTDGTYPKYEYGNSGIQSICYSPSEVYTFNYFNSFVKDYVTIKNNNAWYLYHIENNENKETLEKVNLSTDQNLPSYEKEAYKTPYKVSNLTITSFYDKNEEVILMVAKIQNNYCAIVGMDGKYLTPAIYDSIII